MSSKHDEKRAVERFPVSSAAGCTFASPVLEDFGPVRLVNVSPHGVGFVTGQPLAAKMLVAMSLANPAKKFSKTMLVRVVHATAQPGGSYLVGGAFETPLTYEELCALVM
jgi:hypothetical protein